MKLVVRNLPGTQNSRALQITTEAYYYNVTWRYSISYIYVTSRVSVTLLLVVELIDRITRKSTWMVVIVDYEVFIYFLYCNRYTLLK